AQIDVQLKRRHDLIPNLVETAKAFLSHERETLEAVIAARNSAEGARTRAAANPGDAQAMQGLASAEAGLSGVLGRFFALSEAYPDLKSNQNMMQLSEELSTTENKIAFARQSYNDAVMRYNNKCEMVPSSLVAGALGFKHAEFFEVGAPFGWCFSSRWPWWGSSSRSTSSRWCSTAQQQRTWCTHTMAWARAPRRSGTPASCSSRLAARRR
ncbi:MAG: LemA family protein, partial [Deltaproteobacteria bacterium]|nr:LemA family protein [Deltaproteobacteria bacterium]